MSEYGEIIRAAARLDDDRTYLRAEVKELQVEIKRLQFIMDKLQQTADTGILPDGDHVNLPTRMWLEDLDTLLNVAVEKP